MIVKDEKFLDTLRGTQFCEIGQHRVPTTEPCHIRAKGLAGGSRLDIPENVVAGCRRCHDLQHRGIIHIDTLWKAAARRLGRTVSDLQELVNRYLRSPKNGPLLPKEDPASTTKTEIPEFSVCDQEISKENHCRRPTKEPTMSEANGVQYHPVADKFPRMSGEPLQKLEDSIRKRGVRVPVLFWNSFLMDGRHRWEIAHELGISCPTKELDGDEADAIMEAIDHNANRRDLTPEQKLMSIAECVALYEEKAKIRKSTDNSKEKTKAGASGKFATSAEATGKTREKLAEQAGVSPRTMQDAVKVAKEGTDEEKREVASGKTSVSSAAKKIRKKKKKEPEKPADTTVELHWDARGRLIFDNTCLDRHLASKKLVEKGKEIESIIHGLKKVEQTARGKEDNDGEVPRIKTAIWTWEQDFPGCVCPVCYGTGEYSQLALQHILNTVSDIKSGNVSQGMADLKETPSGDPCPYCKGDKWNMGMQHKDITKMDESFIFSQHCPWRTDAWSRKAVKA